MPGKVFISCGQRDSLERAAAAEVSEWFSSEGFQPYVAIESQSIQDVNSGIIGNLTASDYYVFIDFRREQIGTRIGGALSFRGSLFTQQELAIAYVLGFEHCVFLQQTGVSLEGIGQYILSNAASFDEPSQVLIVLQQHVKRRNWKSDYSRHLCIETVHWSDRHIQYRDHTGQSVQRVLFGKIQNRRHDVAAIDVALRLVNISVEPNGRDCQPVDRSNLKWAGHPAYACTIRPRDYEEVSLLALNVEDPTTPFLHSALDVIPRQAILRASPGAFLLTYEGFAQQFPILRFTVRLTTRTQVDDAQAEIVA